MSMHEIPSVFKKPSELEIEKNLETSESEFQPKKTRPEKIADLEKQLDELREKFILVKYKITTGFHASNDLYTEFQGDSKAAEEFAEVSKTRNALEEKDIEEVIRAVREGGEEDCKRAIDKVTVQIERLNVKIKKFLQKNREKGVNPIADRSGVDTRRFESEETWLAMLEPEMTSLKKLKELEDTLFQISQEKIITEHA